MMTVYRKFYRFLGMKPKLGENSHLPPPPLSLQMNFHPRPVTTVTSRKYSTETKETHPLTSDKVAWENCLMHLGSIESVFMSFPMRHH